jgi:hydroxyacylglutathione hydrolase
MSDLDIRAFTVGPVQENCYIVRADPEAQAAVIIDPGEEPERLLRAIDELGVQIEAILITHCHFDHIGAVAPLATATNAPVSCPELERMVLSDIDKWVPPGFGPFESWEPEQILSGSETLAIAGLEIEVLFTPGHSPGHLTYAIGSAGDPADASSPALLSGDVLFQGSVGRVDLPGGDWNVLEQSIGTLMRRFPLQSMVYPGHMGITTLGRELQSNPFLSELREDPSLAPVKGFS